MFPFVSPPLCLPLCVSPFCCVSPEAGWLEDFDLTFACSKFLFPSPYLPVPNSCGTCFLPTCQFRPWKSHSGLGSPMSCGKFVSLGCPISCGKFLLPSPYLPVPTLDVPSPVVKFLFPSPCLPVPNSCGTCFLPTCQFRPWKSHSGLGSPMSCGKFVSLGCPISCGKFLLPSPYLPVPTLDVPSPVVKFLFPSPCLPVPNSCGTCFLPTCQFRPWKSHSGLGSPMSCGKFVSLGCPISCGKFLLPSPYLPVPTLDVPSPVVKFLFPSPCLPVPNSCGTCFLPTCQFRPWKSHSGLGSPMSCGKFVSLGCPISCGKFLLPSPYLPVPTLDVPSPVVKLLFPSPCLPVPNSCGTCFLPTCQFRPWKSHSGLGSPMSCGKFVSLGCPISCGKFLLPSPYLPVPTLDVPSPVVKFLFPSPCLPVPNSCGTCFLPTCQFRPWKSHSGLGSPMSCGKFVSLGCPISCGKFLLPSPYLPVPTLDAPSPVVKFLFRLPACQFPTPVVHVSSQPASSGLGSPIPALEVPCHVVNSSPLDVPSPAANSSYRLPTCQFPP